MAFICPECQCKEFEEWYCQACGENHKRCKECGYEKNCLEHY